MRISESRRAMRALLLHAMEQCQRHMDACPQARQEWETVAHHMQAVQEELELRFSWSDLSQVEHHALVEKAQAHVADWQQRMADIRLRHPLDTTLEWLPTWPNSDIQSEAQRIHRTS